jgi:hypothetical protein
LIPRIFFSPHFCVFCLAGCLHVCIAVGGEKGDLWVCFTFPRGSTKFCLAGDSQLVSRQKNGAELSARIVQHFSIVSVHFLAKYFSNEFLILIIGSRTVSRTDWRLLHCFQLNLDVEFGSLKTQYVSHE